MLGRGHSHAGKGLAVFERNHATLIKCQQRNGCTLDEFSQLGLASPHRFLSLNARKGGSDLGGNQLDPKAYLRWDFIFAE